MRTPRLTIGLPVYNGERYVRQAIDGLLAQTYGDFELIISDNASNDNTIDIVRAYEDPRIRVIVQDRNIGVVRNHNVLVSQARGELFKWAAADDIYAPTLLERCIALLDARPDAVLAHCWTASADSAGNVLQKLPYPLATDDPRPARRLSSLLMSGDQMPGAIRADDFYGVIRSEVLRRVRPYGTFYHSDYQYMASLVLQGRFVQHPDWLYFRRQHEDRVSRIVGLRELCAALDPDRTSRWDTSPVRHLSMYAFAYLRALAESPLTPSERLECFLVLAHWAITRVGRRLPNTFGIKTSSKHLVANRGGGLN